MIKDILKNFIKKHKYIITTDNNDDNSNINNNFT